jgi:hypothetical protein
MTTYLNRWTALGAWLVLMAAVWALFVPAVVSAGSFALLVLTGPLVVIVLTMLWHSLEPAPSVGQQRVQLDEAQAHVTAKK